MVAGLVRFVAMTTTRCKITEIAGLASASSRKDIARNAHRLPQIQNSTKQISQKGNKIPVISSTSSKSFSTVGSKRKQTSEQQLASHLSRISLQNSANSRKLSSRTGSVSVDGIVECIRNGITKHIVVMVGAGISTPSGIPDFRTPGTGLYDNLKQYQIPYPEAIFDIEYFHFHPKPFFALAKELYPNGKYRPNYVHYFLRLLHDKGLLHRLYTQNIDGLERSAGIPSCKLVEAHGTFLTASCTRCSERQQIEDVRTAIFADKIPRCSKCRGVVKPDIVFFGEDLPKRFHLYNKDFREADLLLVLGTSLEVEPFAGIVNAVRFNVPRLLFNRDLVGPFRPKHRRRSDVAVTGDITEHVKKFVELLNWTNDVERLISESQSIGSQAFDQKAPLDNKGSSRNLDHPDELPDDRKNDKPQNIPRNVAESSSDNGQHSHHGSNKNVNRQPTPFHAQTELFGSSKAASDSSKSRDSETDSSNSTSQTPSSEEASTK